MKSIVHILSKDPDLCECKTRLRDFLSNKERVYLSKTMLTMLCSEMNKIDVCKLLHLYPSNQGKFSKKLSQRFNINTTRQMSGYLSDKIFSALDNTDESYQKRILVGLMYPRFQSMISKIVFITLIRLMSSLAPLMMEDSIL